MDTEFDGLSGKLLIAMPGMQDARFERSVIYMCAHSEDGSMGLIINKPVKDIDFSELLSQLDIEPTRPISGVNVHFGGPVEHGRGFVLHSTDYDEASETLPVNDDFGMTASLDILEDISNGTGPMHCLLALGYAGWGPGQLEDELRANGWLVADATRKLVFNQDHNETWHNAIESIGIDPRLLSATGGHA